MKITMIRLILNSHSIQLGLGGRRERDQFAAVEKKILLLAGYLFLCFYLLLRGPVVVVVLISVLDVNLDKGENAHENKGASTLDLTT
jgi:hypothetical protein